MQFKKQKLVTIVPTIVLNKKIKIEMDSRFYNISLINKEMYFEIFFDIQEILFQ